MTREIGVCNNIDGSILNFMLSLFQRYGVDVIWQIVPINNIVLHSSALLSVKIQHIHIWVSVIGAILNMKSLENY